jgi:hypothetical protein
LERERTAGIHVAARDSDATERGDVNVEIVAVDERIDDGGPGVRIHSRVRRSVDDCDIGIAGGRITRPALSRDPSVIRRIPRAPRIGEDVLSDGDFESGRVLG